MSSFQPVIKWSGSKRSQASDIIKQIPKFDRYYEPFIGGGSIAYAISPTNGICGDICKPLIDLWKLIQVDYEEVYRQYKARWELLQSRGHLVFNEIRDDFNNNHGASDLLFLSRTCVNGLIRFNQSGKFNNGLHHTRKGIDSNRLKLILFDWSRRLKNIDFRSGDYWETTQDIREGDFIYLDPPYFNTRGRYFGTIDFPKFLEFLEWLNKKGVKYALSYDGMRADTDYMIELPKDLYKRHLLLESGLSSFRKVMDKKTEVVFESLYLNY